MNLKKILFFSKNDGDVLNNKLDVMVEYFQKLNDTTQQKVDALSSEMKKIEELLVKNLDVQKKIENSCNQLIEKQKNLLNENKKIADFGRANNTEINKTLEKQGNLLSICENMITEQKEENMRVYKVISQLLLKDLLSFQGEEFREIIEELKEEKMKR